jgi:hypothetical protein
LKKLFLLLLISLVFLFACVAVAAEARPPGAEIPGWDVYTVQTPAAEDLAGGITITPEAASDSSASLIVIMNRDPVSNVLAFVLLLAILGGEILLMIFLYRRSVILSVEDPPGPATPEKRET